MASHVGPTTKTEASNSGNVQFVAAEIREKHIRIAAEYVRDSQERLDTVIRVAHAEGLSLRRIGAAAGLSHEQVRRMIRSDQS